MNEMPPDVAETIRDDIYLNMESIERGSELAFIIDDQMAREAQQLGLEDYDRLISAAGRAAGTGARVSFNLLTKAARLSAKGFVAGMIKARTEIDRTGTYDLKRTEELLSKSEGDGYGSTANAKLAKALEVDGQIAEDYEAVVDACIAMTESISRKLVPDVNALIGKIRQAIPQTEKPTPKQVMQAMDEIAALLVKAPRLSQLLPREASEFSWPGGYGMVQEEKTRAPKEGAASEQGLALHKRLSAPHEDLSFSKPVRAKASTTLVPVLSRSDATRLLKRSVRLVHANQALTELGEGKNRALFNPELHPHFILDQLQHLMKVTSDKDNIPQPLHDTYMQIKKALQQWAYLDGRKVIRHLIARNLTTIRTINEYVRFSIRHYR